MPSKKGERTQFGKVNPSSVRYRELLKASCSRGVKAKGPNGRREGSEGDAALRLSASGWNSLEGGDRT